MTDLPIETVLGELHVALREAGTAVLQAPPGAGKTTRVPLSLLEQGAFEGRLILLEPRRVAARAAAARMASLLGEEIGGRVGLRMRGESRVTPKTRIEVVTEGVLTRMIQSDPSLEGIGAVVFDEFHERSLNADLGLALTLEARWVLRPDLKILVMSATLDAEPVAKLIGDAPLVTSQGRAFPVEIFWADRPLKWRERGTIERGIAALVETAHKSHDGSILVFLPGAAEIRRVAGLLDGQFYRKTEIVQLFGAMPFADQAKALAPPGPGRRRIVLATAIAETSLTVPGVRVVVDAGLARRSRFDPSTGMSRLVTERAARAEVVQRTGRAGREAAGYCYRLWTKVEEGAMPAFGPPEIETGDLAGLALDLAVWGTEDPADLAFLSRPPASALAAARELLTVLGIFDGDGQVTPLGRKVATVPAHPRLGAMIVKARDVGMAQSAGLLAALLEGRGGQQASDISADLRFLRSGKGESWLSAVRRDARRFGNEPDRGQISAGGLLSLAYPDRIARRRSGSDLRYLMSGGGGAKLREGDPLVGEPWLVAADLDGDRREALIRRAAAIDEAELRSLHDLRISERRVCRWNAQTEKVVSERQQTLGAIVLHRMPLNANDDELKAAMLDGVAAMGLEALPWTNAARRFRARVQWARQSGTDLPDMSEQALMDDLGTWLGPFISGRTRADLARIDVLAALKSRLNWQDQQRLDQGAPSHFVAPTGSRLAVEYDGNQPTISVRLQEMLGQTSHPTAGKLPLVVTLLSPAGRPIQTTSDLPGFWQTSYADVRKDMRGRYPKHHWPEDPANAEPTRRKKPH